MVIGKRAFLLAIALLITSPSLALADAVSVVEPPRAIETPTPEAPDGIPGEPAVVLDLVVAESGAVLSSVVAAGDAPFAELARQATLAWRFTPATRDGQAMSAKIRVRVELRRRAKASAAESVDAGVGALAAESLADAGVALDSATHRAADKVEDVTVRGTRPLAPHVQLLASEVREIPGAFGDAFRALEAMPGVVPIVSGLPYFIIRGAPPGNTGYLIDGVRVPALYHFGVGEAVVHPGLIQNVDLYSGAYPARYGRFAGGILSGDTVPPAPKFRGEASIRLLDSGALLEAPFANGRGDVLVSGRYGYPGLMLSLIEPLLDPTARVSIQYWDYQARIGYRFNDGSRVCVFTFGSYDSVLANDGSGPLHEVLGIEFERVVARYTHPTAYAGEARVEATFGRDRTSTGSTGIILNSQTYSLLGDWSFHPDDHTRVRIGADVLLEPYRFDFSSSSNPSSGGGLPALLPGRQNDLTAGLYAELGLKLSTRVSVEFGARVDLFTASYPGAAPGDPNTQARAIPAVDPRLTVRYDLARHVTWISALGIAHQASNIPLPVPALMFSQLGRGLQTAYQASEGVEAQLPWEFTTTATLFANNFTGLAQLMNNCHDGDTACERLTVHGRAYGFEFLLRRPLTKKLSGWISYTLSRSEREYFDGHTGLWRYGVSEFDRTHVANLILAYDLGAHWRAGGRLLVYTGWPYSTVGVDAYPNARIPTFYRFDFRIEKRWMKSWGHVSFIIEWLNALMQKESIGATCTGVATDNGTGSVSTGGYSFVQKCAPNQLPAPITIPSLGVEAAF